MASDEIARQPTTEWPQMRSGPLVAGGILIGVGTMVAVAGVAVAGRHVVAATRTWLKELETPPDQLAWHKWEQAKAAATAGATAWRKHPNAALHLSRRGTSTSDRGR